MDSNTLVEVFKKAPAYVRETSSEEETAALGRALGRLLSAGDWVALVGELGTGKTVFVKGLGSALDCGDEVRSSTFVIVQSYRPKRGLTLCHVDLYRLAPQDIHSLAWDELTMNKDVTVVEWAEKAHPYWPLNCLPVQIVHHGQNLRQVSFYAPNPRAAELVKKLKGKV